MKNMMFKILASELETYVFDKTKNDREDAILAINEYNALVQIPETTADDLGYALKKVKTSVNKLKTATTNNAAVALFRTVNPALTMVGLYVYRTYRIESDPENGTIELIHDKFVPFKLDTVKRIADGMGKQLGNGDWLHLCNQFAIKHEVASVMELGKRLENYKVRFESDYANEVASQYAKVLAGKRVANPVSKKTEIADLNAIVDALIGKDCGRVMNSDWHYVHVAMEEALKGTKIGTSAQGCAKFRNEVVIKFMHSMFNRGYYDFVCGDFKEI